MNLVDKLKEPLLCLALGLRDGLRPRVALTSVVIWVLAFVLWAIALAVGSDRAMQAARAGVVVMTQGLGWSLDQASMLAGAAHPEASTVESFMRGAAVHRGLAIALLIGAYLLAVSITVRIALELILMPRIQRQCLGRYPSLTGGHEGSLQASLRDTLGTACTFVVGGILCLLVPVVGGLMLFVLACYLNVRSLVNDALDGVASDAQCRQVIVDNRLAMGVLGVALTVLLFVPLAGLLAPSVMGAAVCHLCMRSVTRSSGLRAGPKSGAGDS